MEEHNHERYPSEKDLQPSHIARSSITGFGSPVQNGAMPIFNGQNPMPVPPGAGMNGAGFAGHRQRPSAAGVPGPYDYSRSPPSNKNTAHVPCKFFRQGNCQAGNACPFSHQIDNITDPIPCKYFAKGNCKFGAKCANPHIMADGRDGRAMPGWNRQFGPGPGGFNNRNRAPSLPFPDANGQNGFTPAATPLSPGIAYANVGMEEYYGHAAQARQLDGLGLGAGGSDIPSIAFPKFGSSTADLALSPPVRAMDAQLPPSFDNHNTSHIARFGPAAASVPSTFGLLRTPTSPPLSTVTPSVFGNLNYLTVNSASSFSRSGQLGSSPSTVGDDGFPRMILHSDLRSAPQAISMSVPGQQLFPHAGRDQDTDGSEEELGYLPGALADLLNPAERRRRFSRPEDDSGGLTTRLSMTTFGGSPSESKVGSPTNASPSSRYGALFHRRQAEHNNSDLLGTSSGSAFGHVGSPLRKSSLQSETVSGTPPTFCAQNSSSPPSANVRSSAGGLSMLSQQIRGLGVSSKSSVELRQDTNSTSSHSSSPQISNGATASTGLRGLGGSTVSTGLSATSGLEARSTADRTLSSGSLKSTTQERIDEEFLFSMDDPEEVKRKGERRSQEPITAENPSPQKQQIATHGVGPGGISGRAWNLVAAKAVPSVALPVPASVGSKQRGGITGAAAARGLPKSNTAR